MIGMEVLLSWRKTILANVTGGLMARSRGGAHHFCSHSLGDGFVTWPSLTASEDGEWGMAHLLEKKGKTGFGSQFSFSSTSFSSYLQLFSEVIESWISIFFIAFFKFTIVLQVTGDHTDWERAENSQGRESENNVSFSKCCEVGHGNCWDTRKNVSENRKERMTTLL